MKVPMAPRPRKKKAASRRPPRKPRPAANPARVRAKKAPPVPPVPAPSPRAAKPSRMKMWKIIAYLLVGTLYFLPMVYHWSSNTLRFEAAMPEQDKFFHDYLGLLQNGEEDKALALCNPSARDNERLLLDKIIPSLKQAGAFKDSHLLNTTWMSKDQDYEMVYYLDYEKGAGLADFKIYKWNGKFVVEKFTIYPRYQSFDQSCQFPSLLDISIDKLFFIFFGLLLGLLNVKSLVQCCYAPIQYKWLWIIFILIGFGRLSVYLDPTAGMHFDLLNVSFPVVQIAKNPLWEPWRVVLTLPLGTLLFLYKHRKGAI